MFRGYVDPASPSVRHSGKVTMARVLVVDDTDHVRATIVDMLTLDGFDVVAAASGGEQAVALAVLHDPHVVVMDLRMPGVDGLEATRLLRARRPGQQVLLFTAYTDAVIEQQAREAGVALCLSKVEGIGQLARELSRLTLALLRHERPAVQVLTIPADTVPQNDPAGGL